MNKIRFFILISCLVTIATFAQQEKGIIGGNNWLSGWSAFKSNKIDYSETTKILVGKITTNYTLTNANVYLLQGKVYVTNNAILTIEPGTVIRGDFESAGVLIMTKGTKLIAEGTNNNPIVFTSNKPIGERKPGDWGGVVMIGDAPINSFGGTSNLDLDIDFEYRAYGGANVANNSGILKNVRIEYAGKASEGFPNYNGLTLAGIGNQTKFDFVQVSYSINNSFYVLGGGMTLNNLVSYKCKLDDFEFTQGTQCNLNNALAIRNAFLVSNISGSRCMQVSSFIKKENTDFSKKPTNVVATNITLVNESDDGSGNNGLIREAIKINENALFTLKSSVISGFSPAVILNAGIEIKEENLKKINMLGVFINNCKGNIMTELGGVFNDDLEAYYSGLGFANLYAQSPPIEVFLDPKNDKTPDYRLKINKIN